MRERDVTVVLLGVVGLWEAMCCCCGSVGDQGGHKLFADISVDLVIDVRVPARGGWMSGSGGMGVAGVVPAVAWGLVVGHVLCGAGEEW